MNKRNQLTQVPWDYKPVGQSFVQRRREEIKAAYKYLYVSYHKAAKNKSTKPVEKIYSCSLPIFGLGHFVAVVFYRSSLYVLDINPF